MVPPGPKGCYLRLLQGGDRISRWLRGQGRGRQIPLTGGCARCTAGGGGTRQPLIREEAGNFRGAGFMLRALFTENDSTRRRKPMCELCDAGIPQNHSSSRRDFLKATVATGVAAAGVNLFAARPAAARDEDEPEDTGRRGRRYIIRGGSVMSMA